MQVSNGRSTTVVMFFGTLVNLPTLSNVMISKIKSLFTAKETVADAVPTVILTEISEEQQEVMKGGWPWPWPNNGGGNGGGGNGGGGFNGGNSGGTSNQTGVDS